MFKTLRWLIKVTPLPSFLQSQVLCFLVLCKLYSFHKLLLNTGSLCCSLFGGLSSQFYTLLWLETELHPVALDLSPGAVSAQGLGACPTGHCSKISHQWLLECWRLSLILASEAYGKFWIAKLGILLNGCCGLCWCQTLQVKGPGIPQQQIWRMASEKWCDFIFSCSVQ